MHQLQPDDTINCGNSMSWLLQGCSDQAM